MNIGVWVRRAGQRWHLVESVVAEDAVTRCGRRLDRVGRHGELEVAEVMQPESCKQCYRGTVTWTVTSNDPLQTITGPRVEWTTRDDDPTVDQVDPT